jgi:hypothetical protein
LLSASNVQVLEKRGFAALIQSARPLSKGRKEKKMSVWNGWKVVMLCVAAAGAIAVRRAQAARSKTINEALTFNADGAQRFKDIHWPDGFHPEQADLFAHNEIVVHASCEKVFANIVDAQVWPSWYTELPQCQVVEQPGWKTP